VFIHPLFHCFHAKSVIQGQSENQKRNKKETKKTMEQSRFLANRLRRWRTDAMPVDSQVTQATMCTQVQDPKRIMGYQLSRHKSQIKNIGRALSSTTCPSSNTKFRRHNSNDHPDTTSAGTTTTCSILDHRHGFLVTLLLQ